MQFLPGQPGRIVLTMSADPVLDPELSDGAVRLLLLIRSLAGHSRALVTLTQSLATQLRRHPDTIRTWRDQLEAGGYIHFRTDPRSGHTTITLREAVEPPSRRAALAAQRERDARPVPLPWQKQPVPAPKPDPKPWAAPPQIKPWREIRAASTASQRGAGLGRDIKSNRILFLRPPHPVPAGECEEAVTTGTAWRSCPADPAMGWEEQCAEAARQLTTLGVAVPASWGVSRNADRHSGDKQGADPGRGDSLPSSPSSSAYVLR